MISHINQSFLHNFSIYSTLAVKTIERLLSHWKDTTLASPTCSKSKPIKTWLFPQAFWVGTGRGRECWVSSAVDWFLLFLSLLELECFLKLQTVGLLIFATGFNSYMSVHALFIKESSYCIAKTPSKMIPKKWKRFQEQMLLLNKSLEVSKATKVHFSSDTCFEAPNHSFHDWTIDSSSVLSSISKQTTGQNFG